MWKSEFRQTLPENFLAHISTFSY